MSTRPRRRRRSAHDVAGELGVHVGMVVAGPIPGVPVDGPLVVEAFEWQGQQAVAVVAEVEPAVLARVRCWFVPIPALQSAVSTTTATRSE